MNKIITMLIEISIYSGIIFFVIMLFKKVFKNKISPALHLWVWLLLAVRLVMPFTLESGISFFVIPQAVMQQQVVEDKNGVDIAPASLGAEQSDKNLNATQQTQPIKPQQFSTAQNNIAKPISAAWSWQEVMILIWIAGMAVSILYFIVVYRRLIVKTRQNAIMPTNALCKLLEECKSELGISRNIKIFVQKDLASPALLFPNIILMPLEVLRRNREQICMAVLHELTHYRRKDHIISMVLLAFRAVYWFNPFVWLMIKQARADIETACDSEVVRNWQIDRRNNYAHAVLSMTGREQSSQLVLGMALGGTRKNAEQRIRGIFMLNKSRAGIKTVAVLLACVIGVCCFTTACQPTPEKDVVVNKNDGKLEATIKDSNQNDKNSDTIPNDVTLIEEPEIWQETIAEGETDFEIRIDAPITVPNATQAPVASAKRRVFTQEEVDKVGETLFGKDAVYTEQIYLTKEQIESSIVEERGFLEEMKKEGDEQFVEKAQNAIASLESMYADAPSVEDLKQIDLNMKEIDNPYGTTTTTLGVLATTVFDSETFSVEVTNHLEDGDVNMFVANNLGIGATTDVEKPFGVNITKEQAAEKAKSIISQLTDELQLSYVGVGVNLGDITSRIWGWACVFTREINGFPATYTVNNVGSDMESQMSSPIRYEQIEIIIDDKGVAGFRWQNPMEVTSIENENVSIMSLDEIKQIARSQLKTKYSEYDMDILETGEKPYVQVNGMQLGLMRVDKQNTDEYYFLPVWDVYSEAIYPSSEPLTEADIVDEQGNVLGGLYDGYARETYGAITINAIDGSILNRLTGS